MSKKDEILENIDMIKKIINFLIPSFLAMLSYLFINSDKLSILKICVLFFGIIINLILLAISFHFWYKNKKELRRLK